MTIDGLALLPEAVTDGTLLGGRVCYRQPRDGYRTGLEPVLLAASATARPGERVLEGGTGAGAALLCLCTRLPGVAAVGIERDPALAALARANVAANGLALADIRHGDLLTLPLDAPFDHAIANPPWHPHAGSVSPEPKRDVAKRAAPGLLAAWAARLAKALRQGGSLTLIVPAASAAEALAALLTAGCGGTTILPLWPRAGQEARLMLIRAIRLGRGPSRILPGLVLHEGAGFSPAVQAILSEGAPIGW